MLSGIHRAACFLLFLPAILFRPPAALAQQELLDDRWYEMQTPNFLVISQISARRTERFASELESWRRLAARLANRETAFPAATVPNHVYLFDTGAAFGHFSSPGQTAYFYATPRANYMALMPGEAESERTALHHYAHFLIRNFFDLRLPRWYEEGLAGYLSRLRVQRDRPQLSGFSRRDNELMEQLSRSLSMERLLYRDEALASPRVIQIANLKSEALLFYLRHGWQEEGFGDYRRQLHDYLQLLVEGRSDRFAFDRAFAITTAQLDEYFHAWLLGSRTPRPVIDVQLNPSDAVGEARPLAAQRLALMLGELALNAGYAENSQAYFQSLVDSGDAAARAWSGLGDAMRFQELLGQDQAIAALFQQALERAPEDPDIILDYGEYWEAELTDCDRVWPEVQRRRIVADVREHFERALALTPDSPEANLAMGQVYLFEGEDWREGVQYQRRAFSLLPADSFIMEQAIRYAIAAGNYDEAERLIEETAQPIHMFGEPDYVSALRERLTRARRNEPYDACDND